MDVFTVMATARRQTVSLPSWLARYEEGVRLYRKRAFGEAAAAFQECLRRQPDDDLSALYLKRCHGVDRESAGRIVGWRVRDDQKITGARLSRPQQFRSRHTSKPPQITLAANGRRGRDGRAPGRVSRARLQLK